MFFTTTKEKYLDSSKTENTFVDLLYNNRTEISFMSSRTQDDALKSLKSNISRKVYNTTKFSLYII